tara:strand:+ start:151 stop:579 length:429 start_codon:yes stop_codon:yes gene_type:complete
LVGSSGFPVSRLGEMKVDYPKISTVRSHTAGGRSKMVYLEIADLRSRTKNGVYEVTIHFNGTIDTVPTAYLINGAEVSSSFVHRGGFSLHSYDHSLSKVPGTDIDGWWICHGNFDVPYKIQPRDPVKRLLAFINHISFLLNG